MRQGIEPQLWFGMDGHQTYRPQQPQHPIGTHQMCGDGKSGHACLVRGGRRERGEHLDRVVLPALSEPSRPKTLPALTESVKSSTAVNVPKRRVRFLISSAT